MSQLNSQIEIGLSTNLIDGLNPAWNPSNQITNILPKPKKQAIQSEPIEPVSNRGNWSFPDITLHESVKSLLDELIPYKVVSPASDIDAPKIGAGALLVGMPNNQAALRQLSQTIGVDLTNPNYCYALVKLTRLDGSDTHASAASGILVHARPGNPDAAYHLTEDFKFDIIKLRHGGRVRTHDFDGVLNVKTATQELDSFADYGTHYVSSVLLGDTILQVFAYTREKFDKIKPAYANGQNPLSGPGSQDFAQFTTDSATGIFGYVSDYGNLISLSNSDIFQTTLRNGDWIDTLWSYKNSIFSLFNTNSKLSLITLEQQFHEQTVIEVQLASLSVMIEQKRGLLWQRVFKAAMVQKYRTNIDANFAIYDNRDFASMLPEDLPNLVSYIATPTIDVYKVRLDLAQMQFVAKEEVENFILFSNVLTASGSAEVAIPGSNIKLFAQVLDMRTDAQPKNILLSDSAFTSLEIGCNEFLGALMVQNESGTAYNVIVDGIKFALDGSSVVVDSDVRVVPPNDSLPLLVNSLQYSMTFAEAVMSDQTSQQSTALQAFISNYLNWLATIIPATTSDEELLALRVRALDLANYAINPNYGSFVPILPAEEYDQYIVSILDYLDRIQLQIAQNNQRIANRRLEELTIDVANTLNQNIINTGELVSGIIDANVAQQKDMEGFYDALISQKEQEAQRQQTKINELKGLLFSAQGDVDFAVQQYKSAVEQWQTMEAIKFGLDVATNLFNLGTTIAIPSSSISAVKELGTTVQTIQKTLNVLNATSKLYNGAVAGLKGLQGAQETLDGLEGAAFGSPSTLSWDEMSIQFNQIMATGPDVKVEKAALQAAFSTLILRGKAVTNAESSLHAIERDIYTNQQQKQINSNQAARLAALQDKLKPQDIQDLDKAGIDLMGLTGHLVFIQNQMLTILAKAFLQKDLALQYENLQPATLISAFSLLKFSAAIVQQNATTIAAKSALAQYQKGITNPLNFTIPNVKPSDLTGGAIFNTTIFVDAPLFFRYVDVRIVSVVATIDGVESTESGNYLLKLAYNGTPFHDRNIERDPLNFRTPWRERVYDYQVDGNTPNFSDGGRSWSDGVSPITPFSTWEISFPDTQTNKGIKFNKDLLTITLSFVLEARIVDVQEMLRLKAAKRMGIMLGAAPTALRERQIAPAPRPMALATATRPSTSELISQMYAQGTCTNGWDVVFNMGLDQINSALRDQYESLKTNTTYKNTITVDTSEDYPGGVTVINKFTINYGYPLLTFSVNSTNSATLKMEILSGSVQKCSKVGSGPINCDSPEDISGETLTAIIDLGKVAGQTVVDGAVHDVLKVQLNMAEGAFTISNIDLSDVTKVEFNKQVKAYFVNNPVIFLINELDLTHIPTLKALKPSNFLFKPYESASSTQMLQLFIMTGGRGLLNYSQAFLNNIPEPLPEGQDSSMMVRSEVVFEDVLPQSLQNSNWTLAGVDPQDPHKAWSGKFTSASVSASVDLSKLNHTSSTSNPQGGGGSTTTYTYSIPGGNTVSWSLNNTTLTVQNDGQVAYGGTQQNTLKYNEHSCYSYYPCFFNCSPKCSDRQLSTDVSIETNATLSLSVGDSGRNQTITIATSGQAVNVTGHLSGGGPSGSDDLEAQVNQQIRDQIPNQIASNLSFSFNAISVFALKNLLFPSNNYINFSSSALPGDMLIVGNFTQ
ncbi:MAG: hypothetical protein F6K45_07620 [Kamptonema sp. SIO1D9]|nr:hypothetical protein [Kamptonema sp. SIO1D9]